MSRLIKIGGTASMLLLALVAGPLLADGDTERGAALAYTCLGCHGIEGYRNAYPSYRVPKLGGQRAEYIENALVAYRDGTRPHPTMQAQGSSLTDDDIADLAAWFEGDEAVEVTVTGDESDYPEAGQTCLACHGADAAQVQPTPPVLVGQWRSYLVHALEQYRDGARTNNVMTAFATSLSDEDIARLALFYSARSGLTTPGKPE
ncbi:MAG: cytochrome c [Woeseiaceae bacterium]|nr:cytochrome c [Woeseiaceae bacterium]